uniref:diacylglycerol O-acyltransferase n=1 Tax=Pseudo-nitzschia australis TaxID=44445 RepID=A0A7S4ASW0_9STRA|mmetsp:Transcript_19973/g.43432  ORF Transcript_19973/g.43432 Transcript_19973/m.43432 type:complete len:592 (-) Transcript_19973:129-1904(-)
MASKVQFKGNVPNPRRVWWWDVGVPLVTWVVLSLFFVIPKSMRMIPFLLLVAPAAVGSLRSKWWIDILRNLAKTKGFCVDNKADVPEKPCILGIHPHGKYPMSIFPTFESRPDLFGNNFVMAQSSLGKFIPTVGWTTALCGNVIDATKKQISRALGTGKHVGLMPGGAREMVHCQPFSENIPLVKRTGFLRLAHRLATEGNPTCLQTSCAVVPCFVFGLHDSFTNPLAAIDAKLYKNTGVNIPLWLPTSSKDSFGTHMVIGKGIDPGEFESVEDFANAYYCALEDLFETHKGRFVGYKTRRLEWITPTESKKKAANRFQRNISGYAFRTKFGIGFLLSFLVNSFLRGKLMRLSTSQVYDFHHRPALGLHLVGSFVWVLASRVLTIKISAPYHRLLGYIALLSMTIICGSAYYLVMATWADALVWKDDFAHIGLHSFCNILVAGVSQIQLGFALAAATAKETQLHSRSMGILHRSMLLFFLPRLSARLIRWLFPLNGVQAYSVAVLLQYCIPLCTFSRITNTEIRRVVVPSFWMGAILSMVSLLVEYCTNFRMMIYFSFFHPLLALVIGIALFGLGNKRKNSVTNGMIQQLG